MSAGASPGAAYVAARAIHHPQRLDSIQGYEAQMQRNPLAAGGAVRASGSTGAG